MCLSMYSGYRALCLGPMALTSMLVAFSVIIPLIYSLTFGNETLKALQCMAFVFLLADIILANYDKLKVNSEKPKSYGLWLLFIALTFISNGICSILQKEHQLAYPGLYSREFIMFAMLICSLIFTLTAIIKIPLKDVKSTRGKRFGIISGVTNALANFLTLILAGMENASVLFPIISAGTILGALLCGKFVFKEKLKPNHYLALAAGIIAVVFLKL